MWSGALPLGAALGVVCLPLALRRIQQLRARSGAALNPMLGQTARDGLALSVLVSAGVLL